MLYVACGACRNVNPLYCTGGVPLHAPLLAMQGLQGPQCPLCGPLLPWFVCGRCGLQQMMFFPSMSPLLAPQWTAGHVPYLAPVVQAPPGVNGGQLNSLITKSLIQFVTNAAAELGKDFGGAVGGWLDGSQTGFNNGW